MPNHIKNRLILDGSLSDLNSMIERFSTYQPACLRKTHDEKLLICYGADGAFCWFDLRTGKCSDRNDLNQHGLPDGFEPEIQDGYLMFPDFKKVIAPPDDPAYRDEPSQDAVKNSHNWWYTWNMKHWGSKWGGYDYERKAINIFEFETAWSGCPMIIEAMSLAFPSVTIQYKWSDEDTGYNCGMQVYLNGLVHEFIPDGGSKEAYDIAFDLRPDRAENYKLVGENYIYSESE